MFRESGTRVATTLAGVSMAFGMRPSLGIQRHTGMLLLAIWLILYGLSGLVALGLPGPLMAILALLAGVLILVGR